MRKRTVAFFIGRILWLEAVCMTPAAILCFTGRDQAGGFAFVKVIGILAVIGFGLSFFKKGVAAGFHAREGFATVALGWVVMSFFGALPFWMSGAIPNFMDCWFESVSGFTTTGATILRDVEALSNGMLYWRSFSVWLGGMGILVFMLAMVPLAKSGGDALHILRAESPGPVISKLVPKMRSSARILYLIYIAMTGILFVLLVAGGMPVFDSVVNAFSTAGTGGFSIKNASIAAYGSGYLQTVISVFMILFGVNFSLYYLLLLRDFKAIFKSEELRTYLGIILASVIAVSLNVYRLFENVGQALHHAFFQVSSMITTAGFSTVDFDAWPQFSKTVLLVLMLVGACAGSTGCGFKVSRLLLLWKSLKHEIQKLLHPRAVKVIKMDGKVVDSSIVSSVGGYFILYCIAGVLSLLILSFNAANFEAAFSSVVSCLNNIGPGFGAVGPTKTYAAFSALDKLVLSVDMLLGRLEFYPLLLLFSPSTWLRGKQ